MMHGRKNKENCALKLADEITLYYDGRSKKHQIMYIGLTKITITVVINLKCHNLHYPCHPVGRPHLTFPVTTKRSIPWVQLVFPTTRIGRLYYTMCVIGHLMTQYQVPIIFLMRCVSIFMKTDLGFSWLGRWTFPSFSLNFDTNLQICVASH